MKTTTDRIIRLLAPAALLLAACSDWTDPESLGLRTPERGEEYPERYAAYLENLRDWKATEHQAVLALYDNSTAEPTSRAHHIASLPDSLDVAVLGTPELPDWQQLEMEGTRSDKGTRFVFAIDHADLRSDWEAIEADAAPEWADYAAERLAAALGLCDRYGYDGILVRYSGKSTLHMTEEELKAYTAEQSAFIGPVTEWAEANETRLFLLGGDPTTLLDPKLLLKADYIVIDTSAATSVEELTYAVYSSMGPQIPTDRFVVTVPTVVRDDPHAVGYYGKEMALPLAAEWMTRPSDGFTRAGLLVEGVERDFYNAGLIYKHTREAIATLNPSPKN